MTTELEVTSNGSWNKVDSASESAANGSQVQVKGRRMEKLRSQAIAWLTGEGAATEQAVKDAEAQLENNGGKLVVSCGLGRALVDHKGYAASEWSEVVPALASELGLSEQKMEALKNAGRRDEGKGSHFSQEVHGNLVIGRHIAYWTLRHGGKISVIYGKHEESMQMSGAVPATTPPSSTPFPLENCIQHDGRIFSALPEASPHSALRGEDMTGKVVEIPSGWRVVNSRHSFESIRTQVVAPYHWHAGVLVTEGCEGKLQGWKTKCHNSRAGGYFDPADYVTKLDACRYQFDKAHVRLLIERVPESQASSYPAASFALQGELASCWKRFVQLSAQREWSQQLGSPGAQD